MGDDEEGTPAALGTCLAVRDEWRKVRHLEWLEDQCRRGGAVLREKMVDVVTNFILLDFNSQFLLSDKLMYEKKNILSLWY